MVIENEVEYISVNNNNNKVACNNDNINDKIILIN